MCQVVLSHDHLYRECRYLPWSQRRLDIPRRYMIAVCKVSLVFRLGYLVTLLLYMLAGLVILALDTYYLINSGIVIIMAFLV